MPHFLSCRPLAGCDTMPAKGGVVMIFYHLDHAGTLAEGQVISPGPVSTLFPDIQLSQFGQGILLRDPVAIASSSYNEINTHNLELHAENIRRALFPDLPSRLSSFFTVGSMEDLLLWSAVFPLSPASRVFEIEYNGPLHEFDAVFLHGFTIPRPGVPLDLNQHQRDIQQTQTWLYRYWTGERTDHPMPEVLLPLPVTIGKLVSLDSLPNLSDFDPSSGQPR